MVKNTRLFSPPMMYWKNKGRLTAVIAEKKRGCLYVDMSMLDKWLFCEVGNTKRMTFEEKTKCENELRSYCQAHKINVKIQRTGENGIPCSYSWNGEKSN